MSEPTDDLFGPVPAVEPPVAINNSGNSGPPRKKAAKAPAKPVPRMVAPAPPSEPKVYEPIPMGREGKPAGEQPPAPPPLPRFKRRRLPALEACDCCDRPSSCQEEFVIERDHHAKEVVRVCETCRASTGAEFPTVQWLAWPLAGPWVVALCGRRTGCPTSREGDTCDRLANDRRG